MSDIYPAQVISQDALRWINFFNGRLLTGDDLTREQAANRDARQRLGQALGDGVAWGLLVQAAPGEIALKVGAGEAVNRMGQVLYLSQSQAVSLLQAPTDAISTRQRQFAACAQAQTGGYAGDTGLYLLVLCPAESAEDRAALRGTNSAVAACNTKYRVEGVQFKLILLSASLAYHDQFRNATAFEDFLAADVTSDSLETPFSAPDISYGRLDGLRPDLLSDADVPLALILRDPQGVVFVDNWSVRRRVRLNNQEPCSPWQLFIGDRRTSEAEAAFLQFQEHLADILRYETNKVSIPNMQATERFKYLPPVGFLPIGGSYGFDWRKFLGPHAPAQETQVDAGVLENIFLAAIPGQPFPLETAPLVPVDVFTTDDNSFIMFTRTPLGRIRLRFGADIEDAGEKPPADAAKEKMEESTNDRVKEKLAEEEVDLSEQDLADIMRESLLNGRWKALGELEGEKIGEKAFATISTSGSNLEIRVVPDEAGNIISPNLHPGIYRINGNLFGLGSFSRRNIEVIGGRVTTSYVPILSLKLGYLYLDAGTFRLCLIPGTFVDAVKQIRAQPWSSMVEIGAHGQGPVSEEVASLQSHLVTRDGALAQEVVARFRQWLKMLSVRFPEYGIGSSQPRLFVNHEYNLPRGARLQDLPEVPQAYLVFGNFGIPLTIMRKKIQKLTLLAGVKELVQSDKALFGDLILYGILTVDQIAGAWVQVIVEATGLSSRNARLLINRAIQYLAK